MADASPWIAIVDDDLSMLKALRAALLHRGLQAKTFGSAEEFIDSLPAGLPECLIVDLQMPKMSGLELHHYLMRNGLQIPTIIITAHADRVRQRSEFAGIIAVLPKPLEKASLFAAIDAASKSKDIRDHRPS